MTSDKVITTIRNRINKLNPSLSFQDRDLWTEFIMARARVFSNRLSRGRDVSRLAYHKVCLKMRELSPDECCAPENCRVMESIHQIPSYLEKGMLIITNSANQQIPMSLEHTIEDDLKYNPGYMGKPVATIVNSRIRVYNSSVESIRIEALWVNPLDLLFIQECTTDDEGNLTGDACIQDNKDLITLSEERMLDIINIVINSLGLSLQIPGDNTGDNNEKA